MHIQKKVDWAFVGVSCTCEWVSEYDHSSTLASGGALSEERIDGPAIKY